jgi:hypothetical protein
MCLKFEKALHSFIVQSELTITLKLYVNVLGARQLHCNFQPRTWDILRTNL